MSKRQPLTPEILVPRLGEYLLQQNRITATQLQNALAYQQEQLAEGHSILLGDALVTLNSISKAELDATITEQIIQLRAALQDANRNLEKRVQERTAELQDALKRLSELNQLKANFVSNVSHELRTPLTHIKGYLELLTTESLGVITDEQRHALQVSQRSANKLQSLIDDLIMFSMTSRGELTLNTEDIDLPRLLKQITGSSQLIANQKEVSFALVIDENIPPIRGDMQKLNWAISQLVENAIKFTEVGGRISLNVKKESEHLVLVSISDTGIGIPQEKLEEIFEPFHQLDNSATRRHGGTGLGLSLVKQIIEAHGSTIEVKSIEGLGTTFKFLLIVSTETTRRGMVL